LHSQVTISNQTTIFKLKHQILNNWNFILATVLDVQLAVQGVTLQEHLTIKELGIAAGETIYFTCSQDQPTFSTKRKSEDESCCNSSKKMVVDR